MGKDEKSYNTVILDLDVVIERFHLFNKIYPAEALDEIFKFDANLDTNANLEKLARFLLSKRLQIGYLFVYKPIFLEVLSRWLNYGTELNNCIKVFDGYCRIIGLLPVCVPLVEQFMDRENAHLIAILQNPSGRSEEELRIILLAYYRLLYQDKRVFTRFVRVDVLYSLICSRKESIVKFLALKILSLYLDGGEKIVEEMIEAHISRGDELHNQYEFESHVDYRFLELNEARRYANFSRLPEVLECFERMPDHQQYLLECEFLSQNVVSVCGVLVPIMKSQGQGSIAESSFVPTKKSINALRKLANDIRNGEHIMLCGKAGSGKTFLVDQLGRYTGKEERMVKIHLGEQTDAKLLIGTYTSGDTPGTFRWKSGVLTTAVREGRWVLIEDIDRAPTEILSILLTLLEKRELTIPSRGETIRAANGFLLISTIQTDEFQSEDTAGNLHLTRIIGSRIWKVTQLEELDDKDLQYILCYRYPILVQLVSKVIRGYKAVREVYLDQRFTSLNGGVRTRIISIRDLMKLCARLEALFANNNISSSYELIESGIFDDIFAEAVDCFAGAISESRALELLVRTIGESLEIPISRIGLYLSKHIPRLDNYSDHLKVGRAILLKNTLHKKSTKYDSFATTCHSLRLMEQISVAIQMGEPVLLVGETGTGKTTIVQHLGKLVKKALTVINVSQQTETGDLLGAYKPVNSKTISIPVQEKFESLFALTFSSKKNEQFYKILHKCFNRNQWKYVIRLWKEAYKMAKNLLSVQKRSNTNSVENKKKKRKLNECEQKYLSESWEEFNMLIEKFEFQSSSLENTLVFDFVEGALVKAVRNGEWLLLDEINLASPDTLESISGLLEQPSKRGVLLSDKGEIEPIRAHPDFRIFACMNPATDVGKRDLPPSVRSRFTEIYVHSPDRNITDLLSIIDKYIKNYSINDEWVGNDIAGLYLEAKKLAESNQIVDGSNQKPHFSIRTLTRTLLYVCDVVHIYGLRRSLYDGFCMSFLTLLDGRSESILEPIIKKYTLGKLKNVKAIISQIPSAPGSGYIQFKHHWLKKGSFDPKEKKDYIITPFVEKNMMNLVRAVSSGRFPVLIQGPTSAGKTSMIKYLADMTGHKFVRINNHEHTDLQEYLGTYVASDTGKLSFQEGVLVEALRKGYWIVLDELNLAPTDILEALNRLLDDNRELLIPETQEVVNPHPDFMLFATQNPPGVYGGRKILSRAFRNRFLELHFADIPQEELEVILRERCQIASSYAKRIVEVYRQLSIERSASRLFEEQNSLATLRDLFRWALRDAIGYEQLAANGYMLLGERCRTDSERNTVKRVLEKVMRVKLDMVKYYAELENSSLLTKENSVVWTKALRRLLVLVETCMRNKEPILLVGETGCGKTTICQLLASYYGKKLIALNAHQNTETSDILGTQRPVRNRSEIQVELCGLLQSILDLPADRPTLLTLEELIAQYDAMDKTSLGEKTKAQVKKLRNNLSILFEWHDGPLVQAMKTGDFFLVDEISLADDSVLERLNSILESERSLLLAEKGSADNLMIAAEDFQFFATMNPGGDYGKKELSPALRNRFTEIWVSAMDCLEDVRMIVSSKIHRDLQDLVDTVVLFTEWFTNRFGKSIGRGEVISLRDILIWIEFMNRSYEELGDKGIVLAHGAAMVFIDTLGTNNTAYLSEKRVALEDLKWECINKLSNFSHIDLTVHFNLKVQMEISDVCLRIGPFKINRKKGGGLISKFNWNAPTTAKNLLRVVRAMQVHKPILLEGSPGVGKTTLVASLAENTGNKLTRINLSEHTDLVDLFGSDIPGERAGEFVWRDAPFLRSMQEGNWVLLDEMNLASQSVLEGLNACLDHRGEVYIPELDRSFSCHPNFKVFAAQNPQYQGGGRKGLPKSFINRFIVVFSDTLTPDDLLLVASGLYPDMDSDLIKKIIQLMSTLENEVCTLKSWGCSGSPWEFNLRDTLRWLQMINRRSLCGELDVFEFIDMTVVQRFRSESDKSKAREMIELILGPYKKRENFYEIRRDFIQINGEIMKRNPLFSYPMHKKLLPLECNFPLYESALRAIKHNWPLILVGPAQAGKSAIIEFLACILGARVSTFSMNGDIDSMDILGGYEQVDLTRKISYIVDDLKLVLREILLVNLYLNLGKRKAILAALELFSFIHTNVISVGNFKYFNEKFERLFLFLYDNPQLQCFSSRIQDMSRLIQQDDQVKFEWFDGMLLQVLEKGGWLVLDNANLCSPSVLDRLNSLLDNDGSLVISECGEKSGKPRIVTPHQDFRLFLTLNPRYGELSRAMRNRCVELFVDELSSRVTYYDCLSLGLETSRGPLQLEDTDINSPLRKSFSDAFSPLKSHLPVQLASAQIFGQLHDIIHLSRDALSVDMILGVIPISYLKHIKPWMNNISLNRQFFERSTASKICELLEVFEKLGIIRKINDLFSVADERLRNVLHLPFSGISEQPFLPLLNTYLLPFIFPAQVENDTLEVVYLFNIVKILYEAINLLEQSKARSEKGKPSSLSYLELSAAVASGRNIKNHPRIPVFQVLQNMVNHILQIIKDEKLFQRKSIFESLWRLLILWLGIFKTSARKDEAKLRAYKDLLQEWQASTQAKGLITSEFCFLSRFGDEVELQRGVSISLIWKNFKQPYPSSSESWSLWSTLLNISTKFDDVVKCQYVESYPSIDELRNTFCLLFEDLLSGQISGFTSLLSNLESGIETLENISNKFLSQRINFFEEEFDDLVRLVFDQDDKTVRRLASFSSIPTRKIIKQQQKRNSYPAVFDVLWTETGETFPSSTTCLITSSFFERIIIKSESLEHCPGSLLKQILTDMKSLLSCIIDSSLVILQNQLAFFSRLLRKWIIDVIQIHVKEEVGNFDADTLREQVLKESDEIFIKVFVDNLLPALKYAATPPSFDILGRAWVLFGCGMVQLYVPDHPLDPAIHEYISYKTYCEQRSLSNRIKETLTSVRQVTSGDGLILAEKVLLGHLPIVNLEKPKIYRPESPIDDLFDEWNALLNSALNPKEISSLMKAVDDWNNNTQARLDIFQFNTSFFLRRLQTDYEVYADLNDIFSSYVLSMKFGFDLMRCDRDCKEKKLEMPLLWSVDPLKLTCPASINRMFTELSLFFKRNTTNSTCSETMLIFLMQLFKFHNKSEVLLPTFNATLQILYFRWSRRRMKNEQEVLEKGNIFRFEDAKEDLEQDFKRIFPDYEEAVSSDDEVPIGLEDRLRDVYYSIARIYISIFEECNNRDLGNMIEMGAQVVKEFSHSDLRFKSGTLDEKYLTAVVHLLSKTIGTFETSSHHEDFNFYKDYSITESQSAICIVEGLRNFVHKLLGPWPEHAVLNELLRICGEYLSYKSSTPVAKLLQKMEQIYTFVSEWEKYSSSQASMRLHLRKISDLIISWRKMELQCWSGLLKSEENEINKNIGKWWFHLFEIIIVTGISDQGTSDNRTTLVSHLNVFLSKSTYGEFNARMNLLKAFSKHVELLGWNELSIFHSINNVLKFYDQFTSTVREHIENSKKSLEKEISEIILLASWKDVNIHALKQSSRHSHNSLYKVVRRYRVLLSESVQQTIENGVSFSVKASLPAVEILEKSCAVDHSINSATKQLTKLSWWSSRSALMKNPSNVYSKMGDFVSKTKNLSFPSLLDFATTIYQKADSLQKDTPKIYSKNQKKKIASLKVLKSKLLSDSLKELKRMGLRTHFREDIHKVQLTSTAILSNIASFNGTVLEDCDEYFFGIIDLLPRLRATVSEPSENIPFSSIEKGMAIGENLIFSLISVRQPIYELSIIHCRYQKLLNYLNVFALSKGPLNHSSSLMSFSKLKSLAEWFPVLLEYAIVTLSIMEQENGSSSIENASELVQIKVKVEKFHSKFCAIDILDAPTKDLLDEFGVVISNVIESLSCYHNNRYSFIFETILNWLNERLSLQMDHCEVINAKTEDFDQFFRSIFTSLVLSFQKIMNMKLYSVSENHDKWLSVTAKQLMNANKIFINSRVLEKLHQTVEQIRKTHIGESNNTLIRAIVSLTLPAITSYYNLLSTVLSKSRAYFVTTSEGTYILLRLLYNLARNGFCAPEPPSEMHDDKNLDEGTGLGDGEGKEDNSRDVASDEDLTEKAEKADHGENDEHEQDMNENKNDAVEIEGEMGGDIEELSEQDSTGELSSDENEMDEEVDNVDEDDPNAIDDKMWAEKPESESKEKSSENNVKGQRDDGDIGASERDDNEMKELSQQQGESEDNNGDLNDANEDANTDAEKEEEEDEEAGQDDIVRQGDETNTIDAPEVETLDLPENMNLDSDGDKSEDEEENMNCSDIEMDNEEEVEENQKRDYEYTNPEDQDSDVSTKDEKDLGDDGEAENEGPNEESSNQKEGKVEEEEIERGGYENASDEEELVERQMEKNSEKGNNNGNECVDGLDSLLEAPTSDDGDPDAAAQQESGNKGAGSDSKDINEQHDVGGTGDAQDAKEEQEKEIDSEDVSREDAKEAFKQLGDSMKEYYNHRKEIEEATRHDNCEETINKANERPDEFEHVDGANTETNTQALGAANQEQVLPIDRDKAFDDEDEQQSGDGDIEMLSEEQGPEKDCGEPENDEVGEENENIGPAGVSRKKRHDLEYSDSLYHDIIQNSEDALGPLFKEIDDETHRKEMEKPIRDLDESRMLWQKSVLSTSELSAHLSEQLRLILEPTLATKLRGDYKSGKRLNMKKIIPYIASQFRKDKIWLRRTKPSQRQYQIMIALDDSKSMSESNCVKLAFDSLCLVSKTLTQLESGGLSIVKFGRTVKEVHPFNNTFNDEVGARAFQWFGFQETKTDIKRLVEESIKIFARSSMLPGNDQWRLEIVISDGLCEDHETVQCLVRRARENKIMVVFVIIDGINSDESILDMGQVKYVTDQNGNMQLQIDKYLDTFPFEFYVVVHNITELPEMLSVILRQFFANLTLS